MVVMEDLLDRERLRPRRPLRFGGAPERPVVRTVATRVTAFSEGSKVAEGTADEVFDAAEVKRVFLRGRRDA